MELFLIIISIILLVVFYFLFGALIKFLLGWLPLCIGVIVGTIIGIFGESYLYALIGIIIFIFSILITNSWHNTGIYLYFEEKLDSIFYFKD